MVLAHDTPTKKLELVGLGLLTIDQVVPFHCSTRESSRESPKEPTAKQLAAFAHDTPKKMLVALPEPLGLATIDQLVPFHCSTNVTTAELLNSRPTAVQSVVVGHDTLLRMFSSAPGSFGLVTIDQLVPFQCSTNVSSKVPFTSSPTAKQLVVLGHETLSSSG